ncbi:MAG: imidazole glycerol phosphate synthase subunit HisH [Clostridia bacterium]|nr:imidazole glycerol phosphate synthase subunit HisH [Clostridia bacterium]
MIAIIDYGVGNLFSLKSSFGYIGADAVVTADKSVIAASDRIVLPGVGAFEDAAAKLRGSGLDKVVLSEAEKGKCLLGICLGMQMLFDESHEYGVHKGLGLVPGKVLPLEDKLGTSLKIPHIGWNALKFCGEKSKLYKYVTEGESVYFVHSFYGAECEGYVSATAEYGFDVTASVENKNVYGTQFHPEKSGNVGLSILRAFCEI